MKLLTKQLEKRFAQVGEQRETEDPLVIAKFFNPYGGGTWYAVSYDPEYRLFYGYVDGLGFPEWGSFSLDELEGVKVPPFGFSLERDVHFEETRFSNLKL